MLRFIPLLALLLTPALAETWTPGTIYPGLSPEATIILDMLLVLIAGYGAHFLTAFIKARGGTTGATTRGVALGLSALINGGIQLFLAHGFTWQAVVNWLLGAVFTWFVADGIYVSRVQSTAAALGSQPAPVIIPDTQEEEPRA